MSKETIFQNFKDEMDRKAIITLGKSFSRVRTGRASIALLDGIKVDYYGVATPIVQVANFLCRRAVYCYSSLGCFYKRCNREGNSKSDLGLMPSNDGKIIRLSFLN